MSENNGKAAPADMQVPRHGKGRLRVGGKPGNRGGTGRTPSVIRERLRGSFQRRIKVLEQIADGKFVPNLPKGVTLEKVCTCGFKEDRELMCLCDASNNETLAHYGVRDRMIAIDLLAKYGLGTTVTETDTEGRDKHYPGRLTPDERRAAVIDLLANKQN